MRFMEDTGRSGGDTKRYKREIGRSLGDRGKSMGDTVDTRSPEERRSDPGEIRGDAKREFMWRNREIHGRY
jgi:hypothetical protein